MRLLLILGFLGFRLVITIIPALEVSNSTESTITLQNNGSNAVNSTENASTESTSTGPTTATTTVQANSSDNTSVTSIQPSTSAKTSSASTQITHLSASQTENGTSTSGEKETSSSTFASAASVTSSQKMSSPTATSATETSTSQNDLTSPNAVTKTARGDSKPPETNTASSVQMSVSTQTEVVTESANMTGNTTSSTSNDTQSSTTNGTDHRGGTTPEPKRNVYSEEVKCKKEPSEGALNMIIEQEFNCKTDGEEEEAVPETMSVCLPTPAPPLNGSEEKRSSFTHDPGRWRSLMMDTRQPDPPSPAQKVYSLKEEQKEKSPTASENNRRTQSLLKDSTVQENLAEKDRNDLAEKVCRTLPLNNTNIEKCEVWLSFTENRLFVEVYLKVKVKKTDIEAVLKNRIKAIKEDQNDSMELKKLIAMVVTGSLLLLILLSGVVYRCSQHKSKHKDPYLTEELHTVDNGCHDNPAMDITERDSEMEEKNYCKATFLENTDGWIVPMDTHIKDELEEEDTHL